MAWINPMRIARNLERTWEVVEGGGPRSIRVRGIDPPSGLVFPSSEIHLEIEAADRRVVAIDAALPLPPPYAWGWAIGRRLGLPLLASADTSRIRLTLPLPFGRL